MSERTTAPLELAPEGYAALSNHIQKLEDIVKPGIVNPDKAPECCLEVRAELYRITQTLRNVCVIPPYAGKGGPDGEAA